jgi:hypothetical protein
MRLQAAPEFLKGDDPTTESNDNCRKGAFAYGSTLTLADYTIGSTNAWTSAIEHDPATLLSTIPNNGGDDATYATAFCNHIEYTVTPETGYEASITYDLTNKILKAASTDRTKAKTGITVSLQPKFKDTIADAVVGGLPSEWTPVTSTINFLDPCESPATLTPEAAETFTYYIGSGAKAFMFGNFACTLTNNEILPAGCIF